MATEEGARQALYARLEEVIGDDHAATLMQYLPPEISDQATRTDMRELRTGVDLRMDGLDTRMDGLDTRMDGLDTRMDGLEKRMDRMERHMERFDDRLHELHGALREQTRLYIASSVGTMLTLSIIAFGAARLI